MAEKIKVSTTKLNSDVTSMQNYLNKIKKEISSMKSDVTKLNKMWTGDANSAFDKAFQSDIESLDELRKAVDEIVKYETNAKTEYGSCENSVSSIISSISV